jgi:hypothetical protein
MICSAGRRLAVLATPPQTWSGRRDSNPRFRRWQRRVFAARRLPPSGLLLKIMERAARVELASSAWKAEAPAAIPRPLMAGDEGLEPSYLDLEASVLAAGRISRKLMAELTGIEPVPADRQSAILPIDHSSGSLPWTRTTISAFRAQRPAIGRRGNLDCQRTGCRGAIRTPVPGFKIQGPATRRPGITPLVVSPSCNVCTTPLIHRRRGRVSCDPYVRDPPTRGDLRRDRSKAPMQAQFQSLRVQSFVCS